MPVSAFTLFEAFLEALAEKAHNLGSDSLKVALTNIAPSASADAVLADLTEISYANCSARDLTTSSSAQAAGVYKLVIADLNIAAAGGAIAGFRYVVIYNDTATNKELIGFYDYGSTLNIADGESMDLDLDGANGIFTLTAV